MSKQNILIKLLSTVSLFFFICSALGQTDHGGSDWTISASTNVNGLHFNIATFTINSGVTATVTGNYFSVEAVNIIINGTINANGNGGAGAGGSGGTGGAVAFGNTDPSCNGGYGGTGGGAGSGTGGGNAGNTGNNGGCDLIDCGFLCIGGDLGYTAGGAGGSGGSGGSYGGSGGTGSWSASGVSWVGGPFAGTWVSGGSSSSTYGNTTDFIVNWGSGGGGAGGGGGAYIYLAENDGDSGGAGGGMVSLISSGDLTFSSTAEIYCNGTNGGNGGNGGGRSTDNLYTCSAGQGYNDCCIGIYYYLDAPGGAGGGAGGGSGGGIKLQAECAITVNGTLEARGGNGGTAGIPDDTYGACHDWAKGGAGGGGGRIKIIKNPCSGSIAISPTLAYSGGSGGSGQTTGNIGGSGTYNILDGGTPLAAGTISLADPLFCESGDVPLISSTASATGGFPCNYTYQWYFSTTSPAGPWTIIPGANLTTYNPGIVTQTTWYIRYVTSDLCAEYSNAVVATVNALPTVSFSGLGADYCIDASAVTLTGLPAGGNFTGPGISGNNFDPAIAGAGGPYDITYTYTDGNGCTNTDIQQVTVNNLPTVSFIGLNSDYCIDAASDTLTGSPIGGTFTGNGISGNNFNPAIAGTGGPYNITYTYTDINGCTNTDVQQVTVNNLPTVSFSGLGADYCINANTDTLTGLPLGGTFTGPGMIGNDFEPSLAGTGTHQIIYSYTDGNGCTNADTQSVTINDLPTVSFSDLDSNYCINANPVTLTGLPLGGTFTGPGISVDEFNPSGAGIGTHQVIYSYTDGNGCMNADTQSVTVSDLPIVSFSNLDTNYCLNDIPDTLTGFPSGGTFSGPGMSGDNFDPSSASVGTHEIIYYYDDGMGCANADTQYVTVYNIPGVSFSGLGADYCIDAGAVTLIGAPLGGTFIGNGITGNNFDPAIAGAGGPYNITYTYSDINGCTNTDVQQVTVNNLPAVSFSGLISDYCIDAASDTLTGSPTGGTFSGTGISGNTFDPAIAGTGGPYNITYTYTDINGCTNTDVQQVTVNNLPTVSFSGLGADYCIDANTDTLIGSPAGGTFSGPGISGNNFNPSTAGIGINNITYSYTDINGCFNSETQNTTVNDLPNIDLGDDRNLCEGSSVILDAGTAGYTYLWTGGSTNQTLNIDTSGTYLVTVTDGNGCIAEDNVKVTVNPLPDVFAGNDTTINQGENIQIGESGEPLFTYVWNPAQGLSDSTISNPIAEPDITTIYYLNVTDNNGCQNQDTITITVTETETPDIDIIIYSTFTPNNDGINDTWVIKNIDLYYNTVEIYNRNGNLIFKADNYKNDWDGKCNGKDLPAASYYYILYLDNGSDIRKGAVAIVR